MDFLSLAGVTRRLRTPILALPMAAVISGCATLDGFSNTDTRKDTPRTMASLSQPSDQQVCYDRDAEPYTPLVDAHFHPRPFGGAAIPPEKLHGMLESQGVRFVNYFGIGQILELDSGCSYYLDCPGVTAMPSIKNDFVNGMETVAYPNDNLHITLSMTFMDLAHPDNIAELIELYDREYPGMFSWSGELNVMKQALLKNNHEPATIDSINQWGPFMEVLKERGIPVTFHSDLGNDAHPTEFLPLMEHILETYPDNKIVWAHMGLSKELGNMDPARHVEILSGLLDSYPHLMLDISWDVLYNEYHQWGDIYVPFLNKYSTRILPGTDFVAAGYKADDQYAKELEVTSRVLRALDDQAFHNIALGANYFKLMELDYNAPNVCPADTDS
ncbi:MAG: amidohydrolase family protein [Pseudomonadota bacterium]|nr:amidohydrolase family protein [Pseudomonadota bacterium]